MLKHFEVGNIVLLSAKNIHTRRPYRKLDSKWFGPFEIKSRKGMQRLHPTFYVSLPEPYYARPGYNPRLVPMLLEEGEHNETDITSRDHYEIEEIVTY
jgi:hypothetical protein